MPVKKGKKSNKDKITNIVTGANWRVEEATSRMLRRLLNDLEDQYEQTGLPNPSVCNYIQTALNEIAQEVNRVYHSTYSQYCYNWQELNTKYVDWNSIGYISTPSNPSQINRRAQLVQELKEVLKKLKKIQNQIIDNSNKNSKKKTFDTRLARRIIDILVELSSNPSVSLPSFQQRVQEVKKRRLI